ELGASDEQCDFAVLYGSGLHGWIVRDLQNETHEGMDALFQTIVERVAPPQGNPEAPFLMQISTIGWNDHIGRTGTGRILQGSLKKGQDVKRIVTRWKRAEWLHHDATGRGEEWEV